MIRLIGQGMWSASLDLATLDFREFRDGDLPSELAGLPRSGWYRRLDGRVLAAAFRDEDRVRLLVDGTVHECSSPAGVDWVRQANGMARLSLLGPHEIVASFVYFGGDESGVPPEMDYTPFVEPEDFDFGEFLCHRLSDRARAEQAFGPGIVFTDAVSPSAAVAAQLAALPAPARTIDLGPLATIKPGMTEPSPAFDRELGKFIHQLRPALPGPGDVDPPRIHLAMGLRDAERETLTAFAIRTVNLPGPLDTPSTLPTAIIAAVLAGLDCDADSDSFQRSVTALDTIRTKATQADIDLSPVLDAIGQRVGLTAQYRLTAWLASRNRRDAASKPPHE